jgi:hypothetical protein
LSQGLPEPASHHPSKSPRPTARPKVNTGAAKPSENRNRRDNFLEQKQKRIESHGCGDRRSINYSQLIQEVDKSPYERTCQTRASFLILAANDAAFNAVEPLRREVRMTRQDRLRKQARHQRLHDNSVIDHLAKSFGAGQDDRPVRRLDADAGIFDQVPKQWTGGLPQF